MDEPLSSLDTELSLHMRGEILRLQRELGFTLLHVTHDPGEAADLATRVVFLERGRIVSGQSREQARSSFQGLFSPRHQRGEP